MASGFKPSNINIKNKKAYFDYQFIDQFTAGIVLTGTEIKAIRDSKINLRDSFCFFANNELWAKNIHIGAYSFASHNNHAPRRERKLLLNKRELKRLLKEIQTPGNTIIPIRMFINERGLAKLVIALARGKKEYDKRQTMKERDDRRTMDRYFKK